MPPRQIPHALRGLARKLAIIRFLLTTIVVLSGAVGLLGLAIGVALEFWPLFAMALPGFGGTLLIWRLRRGTLDKAERRLDDAVWLIESTSPVDATLYFNQALIWDGVVSALLRDASPNRNRAAVIQFSKLDYPKQTETPVRLHESPQCQTLLIELKGKYFDGSKLDSAALEDQKRRFYVLMRAFLIVIGLSFAGVGGWSLFQAWRMQQGLDCIEASARWARATAEIRHTDMIEERLSTRGGKPRPRWIPEVSYQYEWDGIARRSTRLSCAERPWSTETEARAIIATFETGSRHPLWVDPAAPERTRLIDDDPRWVGEQRTSYLGLSISLALIWIITHLLISRLLVRLNLRKLDQIKDAVEGRPPNAQNPS